MELSKYSSGTEKLNPVQFDLAQLCDESTARVIQHEVTDGVIAPGYTDEALAILKAKRKGGYNIVTVSYTHLDVYKRQL